MHTFLNEHIIEQSCNKEQIAVRNFDLKGLCQMRNVLFFLIFPIVLNCVSVVFQLCLLENFQFHVSITTQKSLCKGEVCFVTDKDPQGGNVSLSFGPLLCYCSITYSFSSIL